MVNHCGKFQLLLFFYFIFVYLCVPFIFASNLVSLFLFQLYYQAAQMTHILESRLKGVVEEANKERTLKEVFESTFLGKRY